MYIYIYYVPGSLNNHLFNGCFNWMIPNLYMNSGKCHQTSTLNWLFGVLGIFV